MKAFWIICTLLIIGAVIAGGAFFVHARAAKAAAAALPDSTYIASAVKADITQSVASPGQVISNLDVLIKCRASGEVIKLPYDVSDPVKKGDLLLQLDPVDEQVIVDQAQVGLATAQSKLIEARQAEQQGELDLQTATDQAAANIVSAQIKATNLRNKANRQQELLSKTMASQEEFETAETDAAQAESDLQVFKIAQEQLKSQAVALETKKQDVLLAEEQVKLSQIALNDANQQLDYTTVNAPIDAVVSDLEIEKGTIISSAISNIGGGTTVMTLSDLSRIFINASVDESDIGGVTVGQKVDISADAYPGVTFSGTVVRIATTGVDTTNVVTFLVKIEVDSPNKSLLKPQMTANVNIIEASHKGVVTVPILAVARRQHSAFITVVKPDGTNEERAVQLGIEDGDNQEITSGIADGEQILVHKNEAAKWTAQRPPTAAAGKSSSPTGGGAK